jgi:hypothetical protein
MGGAAPRSSLAGIALGIASALFALGLGFLALFLVPPAGSPPWNGYTVLLVDASVSEEEALSDLRGAGIAEILSESTEPVLVSNWDGLDTMSLAEARRSLASADPRLDSYLQRLGLWFEARVGAAQYRAYYIKAGSVPGREDELEKAIEKALGRYEGRYLVPGSSGYVSDTGPRTLYSVFGILVLIAAAAAGPILGKNALSLRVLSSRRLGRRTVSRLVFRLLILLPWAVYATGGFASAAIGALWGLAIAELADELDNPIEEYWRAGRAAAFVMLRRQGLPNPALLAAALLSLIASPSSAIGVALSCLGSLLMALGFVLAYVPAPSRSSFVPMPITGRARKGSFFAASRVRSVASCAVIITWGLCRLASPSLLGSAYPSAGRTAAGVASYPQPSTVRGSPRPLPGEARARASSETGSSLPGIASYLEHRAVQEALPYIALGGDRSDPFAPVSLPTRGGKARELRFDEAWASAAYSSLEGLSVEGMLLEQGGATVARAGSSGGRRERPLAPIESLLYIFLLIPPIGRLFAGAASSRGASSSEVRQEA